MMRMVCILVGICLSLLGCMYVHVQPTGDNNTVRVYLEKAISPSATARVEVEKTAAPVSAEDATTQQNGKD